MKLNEVPRVLAGIIKTAPCRLFHRKHWIAIPRRDPYPCLYKADIVCPRCQKKWIISKMPWHEEGEWDVDPVQ
jgi:hypothetical protein